MTASVTATDAAGNSATFTTPPVKIDRTAPVLTAPANLTAPQTLLEGAVVTYGAPGIVEADSGLASSSCLPSSGSTFPVGTTTVTCTATDVAGNAGTATFLVTVTAAPDGIMFGAGFIPSGSQHHHFLFLVSQLKGHDVGGLEYWISNPKLCVADDNADRNNLLAGSLSSDYGRLHAGAAAHFEATAITGVAFSDDPAVSPGAGSAALETVRFKGIGRWNGRPGYNFEAMASDRGQPSRHLDTFSIVIRDAQGVTVGGVNGTLEDGNVRSLPVPGFLTDVVRWSRRERDSSHLVLRCTSQNRMDLHSRWLRGSIGRTQKSRAALIRKSSVPALCAVRYSGASTCPLRSAARGAPWQNYSPRSCD